SQCLDLQAVRLNRDQRLTRGYIPHFYAAVDATQSQPTLIGVIGNCTIKISLSGHGRFGLSGIGVVNSNETRVIDRVNLGFVRAIENKLSIPTRGIENDLPTEQIPTDEKIIVQPCHPAVVGRESIGKNSAGRTPRVQPPDVSDVR